jgi:hypothetical protein
MSKLLSNLASFFLDYFFRFLVHLAVQGSLCSDLYHVLIPFTLLRVKLGHVTTQLLLFGERSIADFAFKPTNFTSSNRRLNLSEIVIRSFNFRLIPATINALIALIILYLNKRRITDWKCLYAHCATRPR